MFGPETHMTAIVGAALGVRPLPDVPIAPQTTGQFLLSPERNVSIKFFYIKKFNFEEEEETFVEFCSFIYSF